MKYLFVLTSLAVIFLAACAPNSLTSASTATATTAVPTSTETLTPVPQTPTPSLALALTPTVTFSPVPTTTDTPSPSETVLVSYYRGGTDGWPNWPDDCLLWLWRYQLVIYEDGHLVMHTQQGIYENRLSSQEIKALLQKVEATGFFQLSLETDSMGRHLVYSTPIGQAGNGGSSRAFTIKGRHVSIYDYLDDYLIAPVKNVDRILRDYQPEGMKRYFPEELWVEVIDITGDNINELDYPVDVKPKPAITPWSVDLPRLATWADLHNVAKLKGDEILPLLPVFVDFPAVSLFSENGKVYTVVVCPIVPELE